MYQTIYFVNFYEGNRNTMESYVKWQLQSKLAQDMLTHIGNMLTKPPCETDVAALTNPCFPPPGRDCGFPGQALRWRQLACAWGHAASSDPGITLSTVEIVTP